MKDHEVIINCNFHVLEIGLINVIIKLLIDD